MHTRLILFILFSVLWILLGSWFVGSTMNVATVDAPGLAIFDDDVRFESKDHFWFVPGSDKVEVGSSTAEMFADIAAHVNADKNRRLRLVGRYFEEEINDSDYENLGLARSEALMTHLLAVGMNASQIETDFEKIVGGAISNGVIYDPVDFKFEEKFNEKQKEFPKVNAPKASEDFEPMVLYGDMLQNLKMNPALMHYTEKLNAYLIEHPDRKVFITGHSKQLDQVSKSIENSRRNAGLVKRFLVKNGAKSNRIKLEGIGASEPMVGPQNEQAEKMNNRVEIRLLVE